MNAIDSQENCIFFRRYEMPKTNMNYEIEFADWSMCATLPIIYIYRSTYNIGIAFHAYSILHLVASCLLQASECLQWIFLAHIPSTYRYRHIALCRRIFRSQWSLHMNRNSNICFTMFPIAICYGRHIYIEISLGGELDIVTICAER